MHRGLRRNTSLSTRISDIRSPPTQTLQLAPGLALGARRVDMWTDQAFTAGVCLLEHPRFASRFCLLVPVGSRVDLAEAIDLTVNGILEHWSTIDRP